jgi:pimeloyl-ACP methyl ester carboxylesterase
VGDLVAAAHAQAPGPVFLLGTSQGSIAAMNGAANLRDGQIAGIVLTESVSRLGGSHETVFDAHPERVNVPALVVANSDDRCNVAPPEDADKIAAAMSGAPRVEVLRVSGGDQRSSTDCGSLSPHGYYGIEQKVVDTIAAWIDVAI